MPGRVTRADVVDPVTGAIGDSTGRVGRDGYTLGAGLEYMFAPGWSAKVEYDYYNFGATTRTETRRLAYLSSPSRWRITR